MEESALVVLISLAYQAAFDPSRWEAFVAVADTALGGAAVALYLGYEAPLAPGNVWHSRRDPAAQEEWYAHWAAENPHVIRGRGLPAGGIAWSAESISPAEMEHTAYYQDWMRPQGLSSGNALVGTTGPPGTGGVLIGAYPHRDGRPLAQRDASLAEALMPHLQQAARIWYRVGEIEQKAEALQEVLDRVPAGVILLDAKGHVSATNARGDRLLSRRDGLFDRRGSLHAGERGADARLAALVAAAVATGNGAGHGAGGALRLPRRSGNQPLELVVAPLGAGDRERMPPGYSAVVFVADPSERVETPAEVLRRLYGLTPAEATLARLLIGGTTVAHAADQMGVTLETARTYTKRVLAKTGASRQADLVRRALCGPAPLAGIAIFGEDPPESG